MGQEFGVGFRGGGGGWFSCGNEAKGEGGGVGTGKAEIRAFPGSGARFLQPFPKSLVTFQYYSNKNGRQCLSIAVNGR